MEQRRAAQQAGGCGCDRYAYDADYSRCALQHITPDLAISHKHNLAPQMGESAAEQHEAEFSTWRRISSAVSEAIDSRLKAAADVIVQQADDTPENHGDDACCMSDGQGENEIRGASTSGANAETTTFDTEVPRVYSYTSGNY